MNIPHLVARALRPPPRESIAEWADNHRILPETSAEPGPWRTSRVPYLREILDALTPGSGVRSLGFMKSAQIGGTEVLLNVMAHNMAVYPGPCMLVQPTEPLVREWSAKRVTPLIETTPAIRDLFGPSKKNPNNKLTFKRYPGGFVRLAYASAASQLRSDPIRDALADEIDAWPHNLDGEGDPIELLKARTHTFGDRARFVGVSTPTIAGHSRIARWFEEGDQRRYHVPCPHCGDRFAFELRQLHRVDGVAMVECPHCRAFIDESHKTAMLDAGQWIPGRPDSDPAHRSYHINIMYSPAGWYGWGDLLDDHAKAEKSADPDAMRVFWNTKLGLPYEDREIVQVSWEILYARRGGCERGKVAIDACVLTGGVDVQADRLECEIVGWGEGLRTWSVDYFVLPGNPSQPEVWDMLDGVMLREYDGEHGAAYRVSRLAIDTGYLTQRVYQWARGHDRTRLVMPVKGSTRQAIVMGAPSRVDVDTDGGKIKAGVELWPINVDLLKDQIATWLSLPIPVSEDGAPIVIPDGWADFPHYAVEYFKGITGERKVRRGSKLQWERVYHNQEPLDCRVYAYAAALALGLDRWTPQRWEAARRDVLAVSHRAQQEPDAVAPVVGQSEIRKKRRSARSKWLDR